MYSKAMRYTVRPLRRRGLRLTRPEIAAYPAFTGDLVISDWSKGNTLRRAIRIAQLWDLGGAVSARRPLLLPLLDPVLIKMTSDELVLYGVEIEAKEGREWEHVQGWWAMAATSLDSGVEENVGARDS